MQLKLVVIGGRNEGREISVSIPQFMIGRAEDCHLRPNSETISRHHCALLLSEKSAAVREFGSRNGTFVNGEKLEGQRELKMGDRLKVGPLEFEVKLVDAPTAKKRPKVKDIREAVSRAATDITGHELDDNDTDIDSWLADEAQGDSAPFVPTGDTEDIRYTDPPQDSETVSFDVRAQPSPENKPGRGDKKAPGKLPPLPSQHTADSSDAAAAMLKKYFKKR